MYSALVMFLTPECLFDLTLPRIQHNFYQPGFPMTFGC